MFGIKTFFDKLLASRSRHYKAHKELINTPDSYLHTTGWLNSLHAKKPIDTDGNPIPWMNYTVVELLSDRLTPDLDLFEYGSGFSTAYYAARVRSVTSVEYDRDWHDTIAPTLPTNAQLIYQEKDEDGDYCRTITTTDKSYDVVVIDGRDRVNCTIQAIPHLTPTGVIILDDTHRPRYQPAVDHAAQFGFKHLKLTGLKPTGRRPAATTILYRPDNCLGI